MKAQVDFLIFDFKVPDTVEARAVSAEASSENNVFIPLKDVDAVTLDALCEQFRKVVFERAKKSPPPSCVQVS